MAKSSFTDVSKTIIIYKLVSGIIELLLGLGIIFFGRKILVVYRQYMVRELLEDPHDTLISIVNKISPYLLHHSVYLTILLLLLGITKIVGVYGMLRHKEWGLDLIIVLFFILLPFDVYELIRTPTLIQTVYLLINAFIAFYLIEFQPHKYLLRLKKYFKLLKF